MYSIRTHKICVLLSNRPDHETKHWKSGIVYFYKNFKKIVAIISSHDFGHMLPKFRPLRFLSLRPNFRSIGNTEKLKLMQISRGALGHEKW